MLKNKIAVIILNWNGKEDTITCLKSLRNLTYKNYEIIVVDNGSTDNSEEEIQAAYPKQFILQTGENLGYAGGNNEGIKWALKNNADYILLLNNDTVVDQNLLCELANTHSQYPQKTIIGPKIYLFDEPDRLWFAGAKWRPDLLGFEHIGAHQKDNPKYSEYSEWDYITGCALFASSEIFKEIGMLDSKFFLTYEETDWCYRARKAGYKCIISPNAKLWHKVSASFGGAKSPLVMYYLTRNRLLWAQKNLDFKSRTNLHKNSLITIRNILCPQVILSNSPTNIFSRVLWSISTWLKAIKRNIRDKKNRAVLYGLRDYYLRRFGNCSASVMKNIK